MGAAVQLKPLLDVKKCVTAKYFNSTTGKCSNPAPCGYQPERKIMPRGPSHRAEVHWTHEGFCNSPQAKKLLTSGDVYA
ncbi:Uncharacterised protein [uncultured archaeon]|nr:Uncharacterised protein [uncultured archaeon]